MFSHICTRARVNRAVNRKCELLVVGSARDGELMWSSEYIKSREVWGGEQFLWLDSDLCPSGQTECLLSSCLLRQHVHGFGGEC